MVIVLAGRRIDPTDSEVASFPLGEVGRVRDQLRRLLGDSGATALIGSGACGSDLLAMEAAGELGLRRRMVLPFEPDRFRATSVADRPGDWGPLFDHIAAAVAAAGDMIVLEHDGEPVAAYSAVNVAILAEARRLALESGQVAGDGVLAVVVWDGRDRGPGDLTAEFSREARARGLPIVEISTQDGASSQ